MKILRYKGKIDFDDWCIDSLYLSATNKYSRWSSICGDCMAKYGFTKESPEIDYDAAGGVCGCLGCQHTAERDNYPGTMSYIDFDPKFVEVVEIDVKEMDELADAIEMALNKYDNDYVDVVYNWASGRLDIMYCSNNNSFPIFENVVDAETMDKHEVAKLCDDYYVGLVW